MYTIRALVYALASGFAGDTEVALEICKRGEGHALGMSEWDQFVVLQGPRHWLANWAGEIGKNWGLAGDSAFAIVDLDDVRPNGASEEDWANRQAVLVAPREKIRHGLDPRLLPGEYIHDSEDLVALAKLFDEGTQKVSKGMGMLLSGLLLMPKGAERSEDDLYQELIEQRKKGKKIQGREIDDFGFESFKGWKSAIRNHEGLGPKTRKALAELFDSLGAPLRGFDPDRLPARHEPGSSVDREKLRDFGRSDEWKQTSRGRRPQ